MPHTVRVRSSGHQFTVDDDESVLDAALRQGLVLPYGCRNGACGTCKAHVARGRVRYPGEAPEGIDPADAEGGYALLCQARAASNLLIDADEIHEAGQLEARRCAVRVTAIERLNHDVMRLALELPREERLQYIAGQYIEVLTRGCHRRAFSLANAPHPDRALELHVRFVAGGEFTEHVFATMREGEVLQIDGPHGTFHLREESERPALLIAGGTGFAPLKALVEHAIHRGLRRPLTLYWGARARRDLYLPELPEVWRAAHDWFDYTPVLSEPAAEDAWQGRTGLVHEVALADHPDPSPLEVYAAGPPAMVQAAHAAFTAAGLPAERFYSDPFELGAPKDPR